MASSTIKTSSAQKVDTTNVSAYNARITIGASPVIYKIGQLVIIERLDVTISAGTDIQYNVGTLITGLPRAKEATSLIACGNVRTGYKAIGFALDTSGNLSPATFNNIPADASNAVTYILCGVCYVAES